MKEKLLKSTIRTGRVGLAALIAGVIAQLTGDPRWLALTPVISGVGKMLRSFFDLPNLPF